MGSRNRDDFTEKTRRQIAMRAGWLCSYPSCRRPTVGATSGGTDVVDVGVAAHIHAAAPRGPRPDPGMTREERRAPANGIWLCQVHAKALDSNDPEFTVENLRSWKREAQRYSFHRVMGHWAEASKIAKRPAEEELATRLRSAAAADLESFRRAERWISTAIARTLDVDDLNESVDTPTLARGITTLGDLILVASPGMGKTTTLLQIADAVLETSNATPIVVPLGNWSEAGGSLLEAILRRPAFRAISEDDFRSAAAKPGVFLLLDGWNELDSQSRRRAAAEMERLQVDLPCPRLRGRNAGTGTTPSDRCHGGPAPSAEHTATARDRWRASAGGRRGDRRPGMAHVRRARAGHGAALPDGATRPSPKTRSFRAPRKRSFDDLLPCTSGDTTEGEPRRSRPANSTPDTCRNWGERQREPGTRP